MANRNLITVKQKIIQSDGKSVIMPTWYAGQEKWGNLAIPDVYVSDSQQQYPVGTKYRDGDRTWLYGKCGVTATKTGIGNFTYVAEEGLTLDAVAQEVGDTVITLEETADTIDQYAGGYFLSYPAMETYRILSNLASDGTHLKITIDRGLITGIAASTASQFVCEHRMSDVRTQWGAAAHQYESVVGVPMIAQTTAQWQWYQTFGEHYLLPNTACGDAIYQRNVVWWIDGSLQEEGGNAGLQHAGYVVSVTSSGVYGLLTFIEMLQ